MVLTTRKSVSLLRLAPMVKAMLKSSGSNLLPTRCAVIVLYTTERDYPWGTLRSTHASKTKVVRRKKSSLSDRKSAPRRSLEEASRDAREASARQSPVPRGRRADYFRLDRYR